MIPEAGTAGEFKQAFLDYTYSIPLPGEVYRCMDKNIWCPIGTLITIDGEYWPLPIRLNGHPCALSFFLPYEVWWDYWERGVLKFVGYDAGEWKP
jgi:hypothetical protein